MLRIIKMSAVILLLATLLPAQDQVQFDKEMPAGGNWTYRVSKDELTDAVYGVLSLRAEEDIIDGPITSRPEIWLKCGGAAASPKLINAKFYAGVVIAGSESQMVSMRVDDKIKFHYWNISDNFEMMFMDKGALKEILNAKDIRIQFNTFRGYRLVAKFSPAGLVQDGLRKACGLSLK